MGKLIFYIVSIGLILLIGCVIFPYWNKYIITLDLKEAASYGTKHSTEEAQSLLNEKLKGRVHASDLKNLRIEKDEDKTVTISLTYYDTISFFGIVLKELEFTLYVTEKNIKEVM